MKQLLMPILLVANLAVSSTVLALAMTGKLAAPAAEAPMEGEDGTADAPKQSFYHEFKPEIVVNFPGSERPRYMQLAITAVTHDEAAVEAIALHAPAIRNDLLMRFSGRNAATLADREGKEAMRSEALDVVRAIMKARYGSEAVEDVYFTRFVMQ